MCNRLYIGDNLKALVGLESESVDLIYLDPPFNKGRDFVGRVEIDGKMQDISFCDTFTEDNTPAEWIEALPKGLAHVAPKGGGHVYYLAFMYVRLKELYRVLKSTGSLYLHCDDTMNLYLRLLLDNIFGWRRFRNEIVWRRTVAHNQTNGWGRVHDYLLYYIKGDSFTFNKQYQPYTKEYIDVFFTGKDNRGRYTNTSLTISTAKPNPNIESYKGYCPADSNPNARWLIPTWKVKELAGDITKMSQVEKMKVLDDNGYIHWSGNGTPRFKQYLSESKGVLPTDIWTDITLVTSDNKERTGYPTQKPIALLDRIIKASSNKGDVILDPFCGSGTTLVSAYKNGCAWIGMDRNKEVAQIVGNRIKEDMFDEEFKIFGL